LQIFMAVVAVTGLFLSAAITERNRAEKRQNALLSVSRILADSSSEDTIVSILQTVCQALEWDFGAFWNVDKKSELLRCSKLWYKPSLHLDEFKKATLDITFPLGTGIPGQVWKDKKALSISNVSKNKNFPRATIAEKAGLYGAFAFPI